MAAKGGTKTRRKHFHSKRSAQAIVAAIALHAVVFLLILYVPGHFAVDKETFSDAPSAPLPRKPELSDQAEMKPGAKSHSFPKRKPSLHGASEEAAQNVYCWIDENGIRNFSNLLPPSSVTNFETRKMPVEERGGLETKVIIRGNQVIVPVRLGYKGQELVTYLLLDTGASTTALNRRVAEQLNIRSGRPGVARVADGREIRVYSVDLDYIIAGPHKIADFKVSVIDYKGEPESFNGLLGMNFLREVSYHVDFKRQIISWARFH